MLIKMRRMKSLLFVATVTLLLLLLLLKRSECMKIERYDLLMPQVRPTMPELYLCTPFKVNMSRNYFIVGFEPNATMNTAHHMLVYGCSVPGSDEAVWNCGEMSKSTNDVHEHHGPCQKESEIIYAWARDAPKLDLPPGVGFKVGAGSSIKYLVLQVHYGHIDKFLSDENARDDSGVFLEFTRQHLTKQAGVMILGTGGSIAPKATEYMEAACSLSENKKIIPFAYRTHTHSLGKVVSGYVIKNNYWIELGKRDPLKPQMFYPVENSPVIEQNDTLAARCTMVSNRDRWTYVGSTAEDEMCNFYLMYYVEHGEPLKTKYCFTQGPPGFTWRDAGIVNIPDREASTLNLE